MTPLNIVFESFINESSNRARAYESSVLQAGNLNDYDLNGFSYVGMCAMAHTRAKRCIARQIPRTRYAIS